MRMFYAFIEELEERNRDLQERLDAKTRESEESTAFFLERLGWKAQVEELAVTHANAILKLQEELSALTKANNTTPLGGKVGKIKIRAKAPKRPVRLTRSYAVMSTRPSKK